MDENESLQWEDFMDHEEIAEIKALVAEINAVKNDKNVAKYLEPTISEMQEIISKAEEYVGNFYHSEVVLKCDAPWVEKEKPTVKSEFEKLYEKVEELSKDKKNGIYLLYTMDPADFKDE